MIVNIELEDRLIPIRSSYCLEIVFVNDRLYYFTVTFVSIIYFNSNLGWKLLFFGKKHNPNFGTAFKLHQ